MLGGESMHNIHKALLSLTIVILLSISMLPASLLSAQAASVPVFSVIEESVDLSTVKVVVKFNAGVKLAAANLELKFDDSKLTYQGYESVSSDAIEDTVVAGKQHDKDDIIGIAYYSNTFNSSGGNLISLLFEVNEKVYGKVYFDLSVIHSAVATNDDGSTINKSPGSQAVDCTITLKGQYPVSKIEATSYPQTIERGSSKKYAVTPLTIMAFYENSTSRRLLSNSYSATTIDRTKLGPQTVTVKYTDPVFEKEFQTTFVVNVVDNSGKPISSISITPPTNLYNIVGASSLNTTGMAVTAKYSDNTTAILSASSYTISGFNGSNVGEQKITVTAAGKTATFTAYVSPIKGDLDNDGRITAADARLALRVAANLESISKAVAYAADVDGNNSITASDARTILRVAANLQSI